VETGRFAALFVEQRHPNRVSAIVARHRQHLSLDPLEPVLRHEPASLDHPLVLPRAQRRVCTALVSVMWSRTFRVQLQNPITASSRLQQTSRVGNQT